MKRRRYDPIRARQLRAEKKLIESRLHPCPTFGDVEILHEHTADGRIRFSAWRGDDPIDPVTDRRELVFHKSDVLTTDDFYREIGQDLQWLMRRAER